MKYHFRITKEDDGFSTSCVEIPGIRTEADTMEQLVENIHEVYELWFNDVSGYDDIPGPEEREERTDEIAVEVPVDIAFRLTLYWYRKDNHMTQREIAARLGYQHLRAYQKIECGESVPTLKVVDRYLHAIPELRRAFTGTE